MDIVNLTEREQQLLTEMADQWLSQAVGMASDINEPMDAELEDRIEMAKQWYLELTGANWHE